eukprot:4024125-Prymnesium_polylepis.2
MIGSRAQRPTERAVVLVDQLELCNLAARPHAALQDLDASGLELRAHELLARVIGSMWLEEDERTVARRRSQERRGGGRGRH